MKTEDIVEALNLHIEQKRLENKITTKGHLVVIRNVNTNSSFKVYKEYVASLYYVQNKKKYKMIEVFHTGKVLEGQEEAMIKIINIKLMSRVFDLIAIKDNMYDNIIKGDMHEYTNE